MEDNARLQELRNSLFLLLYNLVNSITYPTRITKKSLTLIDVILTNKQAYECSSRVFELGYSDHLAQILIMRVNRPIRSGKDRFPKKALMCLIIYYEKNQVKSFKFRCKYQV
jgi:hypothetical protein